MTRYFAQLCILVVFSFNAFGEDKPEATKTPLPKTSEAKPTAPKNTTGDRKFESAITSLDTAGGLLKITLKNGTITLELKPDTELVREERGLTNSDLKVGDTLCLIALKGQRAKLSIKEKATVTGINPIAINIADSGTLTLQKPDQWEFDRATPLATNELKVGQTIAVQISLKRDGDITTKRVAVVIGKPQAAKAKSKATKAATTKATITETGNKAQEVGSKN